MSDIDRSLQHARLLFRGDRLTEARLARGLKKLDVAGAVGITPAAVGQFEKGDIRPSAEVFEGLSRALGFPAQFFVTGPTSPDLTEDRTHFRRLRSTSSRARGMQVARLALLEEIVDRLEREVSFPSVAIEQESLLPAAAREEIEAAAARTRARLGIADGPVTNVVMLLEGAGCIVTSAQSESAGIDAYSRWTGRRPIIVLASDKGDAARSNFDAAHELGHLVMHPDAEPGSRAQEDAAQVFASAFLMPASVIRPELPSRFDLRIYVALKQRWRVSVQALLYRARTLDAISEPAYRRAMSRISLWGWRTGEPYSIGPADQPTLLRSAMEALAAAHRLDMATLTTDLGIPGDVLQALVPAPRPAAALMLS